MAKSQPKRDEEREDRIHDEIIADAYDADERAMGWYGYLEEQLEFPFPAKCIAKRAISPLRVNDEVEVIGIADADECTHEIFITIRWEKDGLAVPLSQLEPIAEAGESTRQAVADWHYWVRTGYEF